MSVLEKALPAEDTYGQPKEEPPVRKVLIFTVVAFALLMTTVDSTIVATALHTLQQALHTTTNWVGWTLTAYSFGFVLMLPISGILSQRYGHRRIFLVSICIFTVMSLCCGLADNIYLLIALRVVQAIGGAGITPSVTGLIVAHFGASRDRAVSLFGSIFPIGAMIGPIFGGLFVTYWSWRGIFFVNVPIGLIVIFLALRFIPHDASWKTKDHSILDITGIVLMGLGVISGMFAISYLGEENAKLLSPLFLALCFTSVVGITGFFKHVRLSTHPIIAPRLIYGKGFGAVNLINILFGGITQGIIALVPLYAANKYGINALDSGTLLVAEGIAAVILSTAATVVLRKTGYRPPLYVGCIIIILGTILLALNPLDGISLYFWMMGATFLIGVGSGAINPSCRNAGLQLAPEKSATIAALRSMCLQLGSIITIAVAAAAITGAVNPGGVQVWVNVAAAVVFVLSVPLIGHIQEHKGSW